MVSQELSKESALSVLRRCLPSDMDACRVHSEDLSNGLQWDGRNRNAFIQSNSVPPCFQPLGEQIYMSADMVLPRGTVGAEMIRRCLMNCEALKENGHQCFSYGQGHGLSLTLGSRHPSDVLSQNCYKQNDTQENVMCSNYVIAREGSTEFRCQGVNKNLSNNHKICVGETTTSIYTLKPSNSTFHHMASLAAALQNSPYLKPAQKLLDEVVCVSNAVEPGSDKQLRRSVGLAMQSGGVLLMNQQEGNTRGNHCSSEEKHDVQIRITKLVALLDELESRSEQYFHQMDGVVSSFEVVAGIGTAASYTALTIQAMSKHFSNLRDDIITQIHSSREALSDDLQRNHEGLSHQKSSDQSSRHKRETVQHLGVIQIRQVWRPPLRGLPEDSVAVLRAWLFEHFLHPYPNDNEKLMLASQTGLTRNQISNWFINARVRLWKPMIEEMYREEFVEDSQDSNPFF